MLLAGCEAELASGVSPDQANAMIVTLDAQRIAATKDRAEGDVERYAVRVARSDEGRALSILRAAGLPRNDDPGFAEVFAEASLVPTASEERARFTAALGGELARSVERLPGVIDARVHVAMSDPSPRPFGEAREAPRASVLARIEENAHLDENAVRSLVAFAIPGMRTEDVAVVIAEVPAAARGASALERVGPFAVASGHATTLKTLLGASLALHALLAALLVFATRKRGHLEKHDKAAT